MFVFFSFSGGHAAKISAIRRSSNLNDKRGSMLMNSGSIGLPNEDSSMTADLGGTIFFS